MAATMHASLSKVVSRLQSLKAAQESSRAGSAPSPRNFAARPLGASLTASQSASVSATATAAAPSTPPTIEERRKLAQESEEPKSSKFRVVQVDSAEQKDFYTAPVLAVSDVAPGVRCVTVEAEVSREFVPLDKAYTKPGQTVRVRLPAGSSGNGAASAEGTVVSASSAPFSGETNFPVLYKLRGDISAGSTKAAQYSLSVKSRLDLHITEKEHSDLYNLTQGDEVEVGDFLPTGMDLRPIMFLSRFPTLLIFAQGPGAGIAAARSLIEAEDVGSLFLGLRSDVRLYCSAPSPDLLAYTEKFAQWEKLNVKVKPVVEAAEGGFDGFVGSFATAFDEDDLEYDPETTGAVVCGDKKSNAAALAVLEEAGIPKSCIIVWEQ